MGKKLKNKWLEVIFMQKYATFSIIDFWSEHVLKISTFLHLFAKKWVKPRTGWNGQKMEKQMTRSDFYAKFFNFLFYQFLIRACFENFDLFAKKCVKPKIGLNCQKMEKQMTRSDFFAKICNFLFYQFLIWACFENLDLFAPFCKKVPKV